MPAASLSDVSAALLEDFRAHHQALLQLESEVGRWTTLYAGALALGAAAAFTEAGLASTPETLLDRPLPATALLMLATVNAVYILALAFKGYQCQLLRLYLHCEVGERVRNLIGEEFYCWEIWQRTAMCSPAREGKPELVRVAYYAFQTLVPMAASVLLLSVFAIYSWATIGAAGRTAFVLAVAFTLIATAAALSTTAANSRWVQIVGADRALGAGVNWATNRAGASHHRVIDQQAFQASQSEAPATRQPQGSTVEH